MPEVLLTRYRMLRSTDGGTTWTLEGSQDAHNGDAAVKKFFGVPDEGVQVVAVTERSWQPRMKRRRVIETDVIGAVPSEEDGDVPTIASPPADEYGEEGPEGPPGHPEPEVEPDPEPLPLVESGMTS